MLSSLKAQIDLVSGILTEAYARSDENAGMIFFRKPSFFLHRVSQVGRLLVFLFIWVVGLQAGHLVVLGILLGKRQVFFIDGHDEQVDGLLVGRDSQPLAGLIEL